MSQICPHCGQGFKRLASHEYRCKQRPSGNPATASSANRQTQFASAGRPSPASNRGQSREERLPGAAHLPQQFQPQKQTQTKQICPHCGGKYVNLTNHKVCHGRPSVPPKQVEMQKCPDCGKCFKNLANHNICHRKVSKEATPTKAEYTPAKAETQKCPDCGKRFKDLTNHNICHGRKSGNTTVKPMCVEMQMCGSCGKCFKNLASHKSCHGDGTKKYEAKTVYMDVCPDCNKCFKNLKRHKTCSGRAPLKNAHDESNRVGNTTYSPTDQLQERQSTQTNPSSFYERETPPPSPSYTTEPFSLTSCEGAEAYPRYPTPPTSPAQILQQSDVEEEEEDTEEEGEIFEEEEEEEVESEEEEGEVVEDDYDSDEDKSGHQRGHREEEGESDDQQEGNGSDYEEEEEEGEENYQRERSVKENETGETDEEDDDEDEEKDWSLPNSQSSSYHCKRYRHTLVNEHNGDLHEDDALTLALAESLEQEQITRSPVDEDHIPSHTAKPEAGPIDLQGAPRVVFDTETTGLGLDCHILQLAATRGSDSFSTYVLPGQPITPGAARITGLRVTGHQMYKNNQPVAAVTIKEAIPMFFDYLQSLGQPAVLIGHNSKRFDARILINTIEKCGMLDQCPKYIAGFVDTLPLLREVYPKRKSYTQLDLYVEIMGGVYEAHDAKSDVIALRDLLSASSVGHDVWERHSFSVKYIIDTLVYFRQKRSLLSTLTPLNGLVSPGMQEKMAGSGLGLHHLHLAFQRGGYDGLDALLREDIVGKARVTKNKRIVDEIYHFLVRNHSSQ